MATVAELQTAFDALAAQATANVDAETAAATLLGKLGELIRNNVNDPVALQAIADGMSNKSGALKSSADSLAAAVVANTPAA
jgi:hypothetical protein